LRSKEVINFFHFYYMIRIGGLANLQKWPMGKVSGYISSLLLLYMQLVQDD
jgi:hypothetical protein